MDHTYPLSWYAELKEREYDGSHDELSDVAKLPARFAAGHTYNLLAKHSWHPELAPVKVGPAKADEEVQMKIYTQLNDNAILFYFWICLLFYSLSLLFFCSLGYALAVVGAPFPFLAQV